MTDITCPTCGVALLEHPANRCLDEWIATKVMGLEIRIKQERQVVDLGYYQRKKEYRIINWVYAGGNLLKSYSSDISAAWEIVEKINPFEVEFLREKNGLCECFIWKDNENSPGMNIRADTMPLAISRASLLAVLG